MSKIVINIRSVNKNIRTLLLNVDRMQEKLLSNYEKDLLRNYKRALVNIKSKLADLYEKLKDPNNYYSDAVSFNKLNNLFVQIQGEVGKLRLKDAELTKSAIKDLYSESYYNTNQALEKAFDVNLNIRLLNPGAIELAVQNSYSKIKWEDRQKNNLESAIRTIRDEVTQGLIDGKSYGETSKAITDRMNISANKAFKIVSTETGRAISEARMESFSEIESISSEFNLKAKRTWIHAGSGVKDPRISHEALDNTHPDANGYYYLAAEGDTPAAKTKAPRLSGVAGHDIFCHCTEIIQFTNI